MGNLEGQVSVLVHRRNSHLTSPREITYHSSSLSFGLVSIWALFKQFSMCCLTRRSTGPIAAGRHLGYKSLAQIPSHRNRPVSLYVRHHQENAANFINSPRRDASPHKDNPQIELSAKHILIRAFPARQYIFHQTVLSHCIHTIRSAA